MFALTIDIIIENVFLAAIIVIIWNLVKMLSQYWVDRFSNQLGMTENEVRERKITSLLDTYADAIEIVFSLIIIGIIYIIPGALDTNGSVIVTGLFLFLIALSIIVYLVGKIGSAIRSLIKKRNKT